MSGRPRVLVPGTGPPFVRRAAEEIVALAEAAIDSRGRFAVALAGGSTPRPVYEALAGPPWAGRIAWDRTELFWGDERCVPPDHPDSNYRMAREAVLDRVPIPEDRVHRVRSEDDAEDAAAAYEAVLDEVLADEGGLPRLDLALLGIGPDGHTASLFPGSDALAERARLVRAVRVGEAPILPPEVDRVTLTPPALAAARAVVFLVAGEGKAEAVRAALEDGAGPAGGVDRAVGGATWILDRAAARRLSPTLVAGAP